MNSIYRLNRMSKRIVNTGTGVCALAYLGILYRCIELSEGSTLKYNEVMQMLENVTMSLLLVVVFALILDIHIKYSEN